jgi:hypothetical protein
LLELQTTGFLKAIKIFDWYETSSFDNNPSIIILRNTHFILTILALTHQLTHYLLLLINSHITHSDHLLTLSLTHSLMSYLPRLALALMLPPKISKRARTKHGGNSSPPLGLAYVGISRASQKNGPEGLFLLAPLHQLHFSSRPLERALIDIECNRLRQLAPL